MNILIFIGSEPPSFQSVDHWLARAFQCILFSKMRYWALLFISTFFFREPVKCTASESNVIMAETLDAVEKIKVQKRRREKKNE